MKLSTRRGRLRQFQSRRAWNSDGQPERRHTGPFQPGREGTQAPLLRMGICPGVPTPCRGVPRRGAEEQGAQAGNRLGHLRTPLRVRGQRFALGVPLPQPTRGASAHPAVSRPGRRGPRGGAGGRGGAGRGGPPLPARRARASPLKAAGPGARRPGRASERARPRPRPRYGPALRARARLSPAPSPPAVPAPRVPASRPRHARARPARGRAARAGAGPGAPGDAVPRALRRVALPEPALPRRLRARRLQLLPGVRRRRGRALRPRAGRAVRGESGVRARRVPLPLGQPGVWHGRPHPRQRVRPAGRQPPRAAAVGDARARAAEGRLPLG